MSIIILGDIHFADTKDYKRTTSEAFLNWFDTWKYNSPENHLILAGDLVDNCLLTGRVAYYLEKFSELSRFKSIHICVGNHDLKKIRGVDQLAYEFYSDKDNIHYYTEISEINIEGKSVLILPYYSGTDSNGITMSEKYSHIMENTTYNKHHDIVVGHFCDDTLSFSGAADTVYNVDKLVAGNGKVCLGHIHTRTTNPELYIGSVWACNKAENDNSRAAWILTEDSTWKEEPLPKFCEYLQVQYPEELPDSSAMVPIYTILNCATEQIAKEKYGDIYIRKVVIGDAEIKHNSTKDVTIDSIHDFNLLEYFDNFWKTLDIQDKKEVHDLCREAIQKRA